MANKIFKESFAKPEKKLTETNTTVTSNPEVEWTADIQRAEDYWSNEVYFQIENIEDLTTDERILNATEEQIKDLAKRVANKILNDDQVWGEINSAIEHYIYHDDFMLGAQKKESVNESPEEKRTGHTEGNRLPELK